MEEQHCAIRSTQDIDSIKIYLKNNNFEKQKKKTKQNKTTLSGNVAIEPVPR